MAKKMIDVAQLRRLAEVNLTQKQMAHVLGVGQRTLERRLSEDAELRTALDQISAGKVHSLKQKLYNTAEDDEHPKQITAIIFLLKTDGGMSENRDPNAPSERQIEADAQAEQALEQRLEKWLRKKGGDAAVESQSTH